MMLGSLTCLIAALVSTDGTQDGLQLLNKAATVQVAGKVTKARDFYGEFQFRLLDYDEKGHATPKAVGNALYFWSRGGEAGKIGFRRILKVDAEAEDQDFRVDYDGLCWKPSGRLGTPLVGKDYRKDVEDLLAQRRRMTQLLDLFFLANLVAEKPQVVIAGRGEKVSFAIGREKFEHPSTTQLRVNTSEGHVLDLWIDDAQHHLVKIAVKWKPDPKQPEEYNRPAEFVLGGHARTTRAPKVLVPTRIAYVEDGRPRIEITTMQADTFHFNTFTEAQRRMFTFPE